MTAGYCGEIIEVITFLSIFTSYRRLDHLILIVKYNRKLLFLNQNIFAKTRIQESFVTLVYVISSPKQTMLFFSPFFYCAYFLNYRNCLRQNSNSEPSFGVVVFVTSVFSSKQTTWFSRRSSIILSFRAFTGNRAQNSF